MTAAPHPVPPAGGRGAPSLKGRFPFRVGATSFVRPDDYLPNVRFLAPLVDDIQLLFFDPSSDALPGDAAMREMAAIGRGEGTTFSVHLPFGPDPGAADGPPRGAYTTALVRAIDRARDLRPVAWVFHPFGEGNRFDAATPPPAEWMGRLAERLDALVAAGIEPERLCLENLRPPFDLVAPLVEDRGLSVCLDVGHLVLYGHDVGAFVARYAARVRAVHLHGVSGGRDHAALSRLDAAAAGRVRAMLFDAAAPPRVATLEVFSVADFEDSLRALEGWAP